MHRRKRFFKRSDFLATFSLHCGNFIMAAAVLPVCSKRNAIFLREIFLTTELIEVSSSTNII